MGEANFYYFTCLKFENFLKDITFKLSPRMGAYKYVNELWRKKQTDVMGFLLRVRTWQYRQLSRVHRASQPTRIEKARRLGYRAKQGFVVYRVRFNLSPRNVWVARLDLFACSTLIGSVRILPTNTMKSSWSIPPIRLSAEILVFNGSAKRSRSTVSCAEKRPLARLRVDWAKATDTPPPKEDLVALPGSERTRSPSPDTDIKNVSWTDYTNLRRTAFLSSRFRHLVAWCASFVDICFIVKTKVSVSNCSRFQNIPRNETKDISHHFFSF